ncbi:hypothetical protein BDV95DRAFT_605867 [Massariosphaeria phaeospora]|uniref:Rhodopsin domain-containing protein n=1 Tax=Massariosphaeria phaeospora TaxID=100035 RepID=A0A7C8M9I5_9PLEO|nr:hypothetical protein BDV95DRAFT_605867 [Massariosphaeria phaeospora]
MRNVGLDDWLMVLATIFLGVSLSFSSVYVIYGGTRHVYYIEPDKLQVVLKYNFLAQPFGVFANALAKISIAMFLTFRVMSPAMIWRKRLLYVTTAIFGVLSVVAAICVLIQCIPTRALWEPVVGAKCWNPKFAAIIGVTQSAFVLALLPITIIMQLKLNNRQKFALCVLLGLGIIGGICASIKTAEIVNFSNREDFTWAVYDAFIWSSVEQAIVTICGSVPSVKPLFDYFTTGKPLKPSSRNTRASGTENSAIKSTMALKKLGSSGHTTCVGTDDDERNLWRNPRSDRETYVGNTYEVLSSADADTDVVSTREAI